MPTELALADPYSDFATGCELIGDGSKADCVSTKKRFVALCEYMMNCNPETDFMHVYRDERGNAKFVKSKRCKVSRRISWAWDSITGRARRSVGIGFYPCNQDRMSRWGALDFDAHDGDGARARRLAVAALDLLRRAAGLFLILTKSGSEGWHLFVFAEEFHRIEEWTRFLKQVASAIGTEIRPGCCEIFPSETRKGALPYGIRAPGTWNPKTDKPGLIFFDSMGALLSRIKREKEESPFLHHSTSLGKSCELNDSEKFYSGDAADWQRQFAILHSGTRHLRLKEMVTTIFRQAGHDVARRNADAQFHASRVPTKAILAEHLEEFEELWAWMEKQWWEELPEPEKARFEAFTSSTERELFRLLLNFEALAAAERRSDFPFSIENVGLRLGKSFQHISELRRRFAGSGLIIQTSPAVPNVSAARFQWFSRVQKLEAAA
jgi:hypothetical protein